MTAVHEILAMLPPGAAVLDLGSGAGSFDAGGAALRVVRADLVAPPRARDNFVVCSAARLPFADCSFQAVILNHSLEHFEDLEAAIGELARVVSRTGFVYVAVPDASTLTDRVYRWLGRGGGHVNLFRDAGILSGRIAAATGLRHAGTRVLCTSLSFLNRRNIRGRPQRKLLLFLNGREGFLRALTFALRRIDRWFHRRTSVYGWAFYFGDGIRPDRAAWSNVCVGCGSASPSAALARAGKVRRRRWLPDVYDCPACGTRNYFTEDGTLSHLTCPGP